MKFTFDAFSIYVLMQTALIFFSLVTENLAQRIVISLGQRQPVVVISLDVFGEND